MIFLSLSKSGNLASSKSLTFFSRSFHLTKPVFKNFASKPCNQLKTKSIKKPVIFTSIRWHGQSGPIKATAPKNSKAKLTNLEILQRLLRFVWPKENHSKYKIRVVFAMGLLIGSKLLTISVPFVFKEMVDFLNKNGKLSEYNGSTESILALTMIGLALGYGAFRAGASLFGELRNAIFARVAQSSVTSLATQVFKHLHKLDLNFHLNRQTGALSKAIDRGQLIDLKNNF